MKVDGLIFRKKNFLKYKLNHLKVHEKYGTLPPMRLCSSCFNMFVICLQGEDFCFKLPPKFSLSTVCVKHLKTYLYILGRIIEAKSIKLPQH